jgi:hypothetical protein
LALAEYQGCLELFPLERSLVVFLGFGISFIGTVATITVATIPPFKMILLCKTPISLRGKIEISVFYGNVFFRKMHRQKYHFNAAF